MPQSSTNKIFQNKPVSRELQLRGPTKLHQSLFVDRRDTVLASGKNRIRETSKRSRACRNIYYPLRIAGANCCDTLRSHTSRLFHVTSLRINSGTYRCADIRATTRPEARTWSAYTGGCRGVTHPGDRIPRDFRAPGYTWRNLDVEPPETSWSTAPWQRLCATT